jgi:hypothetical protein
MRNPSASIVMDVCSVASDHRQASNVGAGLCCASSNAGILGAYAHIAQLDPEQRNLSNGRAEQKQSKPRQPVRIVSGPLRFERELFVDYRFLTAFALGPLGLVLGIGSSPPF